MKMFWKRNPGNLTKKNYFEYWSKWSVTPHIFERGGKIFLCRIFCSLLAINALFVCLSCLLLPTCHPGNNGNNIEKFIMALLNKMDSRREVKFTSSAWKLTSSAWKWYFSFSREIFSFGEFFGSKHFFKNCIRGPN